ncbi:hypothetical protein A1O3_00065 [Capronia epimyces CBS 606.96]|uniref:Myb-like domain-containing protein n=1 Tax=Capronia epimyces CBS 606.96 TaxID=1182542 RepID=W9YF59_9EURO|nr:uncharacterized protein A1O3_00065 [Capronia epimyces CBS 606.96]EXJ91517.1 hypothetical protein A1O3_00065 [Capronia epimyces CBS 606.96]
MPYQWTAERERRMLLLAISRTNLRPSADTWEAVAALLGEGLSASAVSQKYYKLRNESMKLLQGQEGSAPRTPTKRKASPDEEEKKTPPSKRARKPKREPLDGVPLSEVSSSPGEVKTEDAAINANVDVDPFSSYQAPFMPTDYFMPVNSQFKVESGMASSSNNNYLG